MHIHIALKQIAVTHKLLSHPSVQSEAFTDIAVADDRKIEKC